MRSVACFTLRSESWHFGTDKGEKKTGGKNISQAIWNSLISKVTLFRVDCVTPDPEKWSAWESAFVRNSKSANRCSKPQDNCCPPRTSQLEPLWRKHTLTHTNTQTDRLLVIIYTQLKHFSERQTIKADKKQTLTEVWLQFVKFKYFFVLLQVLCILCFGLNCRENISQTLMLGFDGSNQIIYFNKPNMMRKRRTN